MKKFSVFLAAAVVATFLAVFGVTSTASAVENCNSQVILKADSWAEDVYYDTPRPVLPDTNKVRLTATTGYWFCPNGTAADKVKVLWVDFCYSHIDGNWGWNFDGVRFNAYYADSDSVSNPPEIKVPDDGTVQNCKRQNIETEMEKWLKLNQGAAMSVTAWVTLDASPDVEKVFKSNGSSKKYFWPDGDVALGNWHWRTR